MKLKITKICPTCEKAFELPPSSARAYRYCSKDCRPKKTPVNCQNCGVVMYLAKNEAEIKKYCSKKCHIAIQKQIVGASNPLWVTKIEKKCLNCGILIMILPSDKKTKFCSRTCAASFRAGKPLKSVLEIKCSQCKNIFPVPPSDAKRKFCSKKCVGLNTRKRVNKICLQCSNPFEVCSSHDKSYKVCGLECKRLFEAQNRKTKNCPNCHREFIVIPSTYKAKIQTCGSKCRKEYALKRHITKKCLTCEAQFKVLHCKSRIKFCTAACSVRNPENRARRSRLQKGKPLPQLAAHVEFCKTPEGRKVNSERAKAYYEKHPEKHINYRLAEKGFMSSLEKIMQSELEAANIAYKFQHKIGRFWADFALLEYRIVIECDGEYWHNAENDARRDAFMNEQGWAVLRFPEKQIRKDIKSCLDKIEKAIGSVSFCQA